MLRFLKSLSRTVHEERCQDQEPSNGGGDDESHGGEDGGAAGGGARSLTVWRKSLFVGCSGFTVINSDGNLVYRVDNYGGRRRQEILLMDASGKPILTLSRTKKIKMVNDWLVFEGEIKSKKQKPICCARKHVDILHPKVKRLASVYREPFDRNTGYMIEGSYVNRSCKVLDHESRQVVAEIRRKETTMEGVSFGLEVFVLIVHPGFDPSLAMAVVLLLDQMFL